MSTPASLLLAALALLLLVAAWGDLRARIIPNGLNGAIALLALPWWWATAVPLWPGVAIQIALALVMLALFGLAFARGMMGGGDVKLLTALALWLPALPLLRMLMAMALLGGVVTLATLLVHRLRRGEGRPEVPYGVAIAAAGLWVITNDILTSTIH